MLADRVGIIDHGHIVAEGTPAQLKAEIGSPTRRGRARRPGRRASALAELLARFGEPRARRPRQRRRAAARRRGGARRGRARARRRPTCTSRSLQLHQPSLDDVFLAKTGRKLEGAGDERGAASGRPPRRERRGAERSPRRGLLEQVGAVARRSVMRTLRQRAQLVFPLIFPLILLAINGSALKRRDATSPASRPVSYRAFAARDAVHAGRAVRRRDRRHRPRARHRDRASSTGWR